MIKNKKNQIKKRIPIIQLSKIIEPEYVYLKLIPSSSISNYDSSPLALLVHDIFKSLKERISITEHSLQIEKRSSIRYLIDISKHGVEFFFIIPKPYKNLAIETIAKLWNGRCTVQEVSKNNIRVLENPSLYEIKSKYEDLLSVKTDKKSNIFLAQSLNIIEIMSDNDSVQLVINLIPYKQNSRAWKTYCDDVYDRYKKNLPVQKNKFDFQYVWELLIASIGSFIEVILPEALRPEVEYTISGDEKKVSENTKKKALDASKIVETQMAVLVKSDNPMQEETLGKSFCHSFKEISENNELVGYKKDYKKSHVSIHNRDWNIATNKLSADELSNFITIAGKTILTTFKNIEHIATKQVKSIQELSKGIAVLGVQKFKNESSTVYLNETGQYGCLPILILTKMGGGKSTWFENLGVDILTYYRKNIDKNKNVKKESFLCIDFIKQNELSYNIMNNIDPRDIVLIDLSTSLGTERLGFCFKEVDLNKDDPRKRLKTASSQGNEMMKLINSLNEDTSNPLTNPMRRFLSSAFKICYIHENKSLRDAIRIIENYDVRHEYIDMIPDELRDKLDDEIRALLELDDEDGKTRLNLVSGIISRVYTLQSDPILKEMYDTTPETCINLVDAMQEGKGIFILMPDDEFNEDMINVVSTYVISRLFFACKKRGTLNANKLVRCTLLIDEINLAPGCLLTLNKILGQLRKYKLRPIISAHNFKQLSPIRANLTSVGTSVILPQGTHDNNFLEFENSFKKEGFVVEDLQTLKQFETLNLIETSEGKKAFISKFPMPVKGKIEDRDDIDVSEFKEMINKRIEEAQNPKNTKSSPTSFKKEDTNTIKAFVSTSNNTNLEDNSIDVGEYVAIEKIDSENIDINNSDKSDNTENISDVKLDTFEDLNNEKYNNLFDDNLFDD